LQRSTTPGLKPPFDIEKRLKELQKDKIHQDWLNERGFWKREKKKKKGEERHERNP
jgi:hypothetical protein